MCCEEEEYKKVACFSERFNPRWYSIKWLTREGSARNGYFFFSPGKLRHGPNSVFGQAAKTLRKRKESGD